MISIIGQMLTLSKAYLFSFFVFLFSFNNKKTQKSHLYENLFSKGLSNLTIGIHEDNETVRKIRFSPIITDLS